MLSVHDLKVFFHSDNIVSRAVDGVSYEIRKGKTVCLVGESGCGKTVSVLAILGLVPQPPGEIPGGKILFKGKNLLDLDEEELQKIRGREISMIFQEPMTSLNPVFTIGDQIEEAITTHDAVEKAEAHRRTVELLADVGIASPEERMKDYPHNLSGGQRQRVMIAMALACKPDLVIADEPTTALDVTIQDQILHLFKELKEKRRMALLYITHNLGVVAEIADRIYVMYAGIFAEVGNVEQIFRDPVIPTLWDFWLPCRAGRGKGRPFILYLEPFQTPRINPRGVPSIPVVLMYRRTVGGSFRRCAISGTTILPDVRLSTKREKAVDG